MSDILVRYKSLLKKKTDARIFVETTKSKIADKAKDIDTLRIKVKEKYGVNDYESLKALQEEHTKKLTIMVETAEKILNGNTSES